MNEQVNETQIELWRRVLCEAAEAWVRECRTESRQVSERGRARVLDAALIYGVAVLPVTVPTPDVPQPPAALPRPAVSPDADEVLAGAIEWVAGTVEAEAPR